MLIYTYTYKRININSKHTNTHSNTNLTQLKGLYTFFWLKKSKKFVLLIFKVHTFNNVFVKFHRDRGTRT